MTNNLTSNFIEKKEFESNFPLEEIKQFEEIKPCVSALEIFSDFIKNPFLFDKLINNFHIDITQNQVSTIKNILSSKYINENLNNIINNINQIFTDNKIDLYDIPIIIKIINENFNVDTNILKITKEDILNIIKIIILILHETKIIRINNDDLLIIIRIIDSSLYLLDFTIKINKNKLCCCF